MKTFDPLRLLHTNMKHGIENFLSVTPRSLSMAWVIEHGDAAPTAPEYSAGGV